MIIAGPSPQGGLVVVNVWNVKVIEAVPEANSEHWYVRFDSDYMGPFPRQQAEDLVRDFVAPMTESFEVTSILVEPEAEPEPEEPWAEFASALFSATTGET